MAIIVCSLLLWNSCQGGSPCELGTYHVLKSVIRDDTPYDGSNKHIANVILYGGESIVSANCMYLLILKYTGALVLYDTNALSILWSSNSSLLNGYEDTTLQPQNIQFFFASNGLYIIEDKFPSVAQLKPYMLWHNSVINHPNGTNRYSLAVQSNAIATLMDSNGNILWRIPYNGSMDTQTTSAASLHKYYRFEAEKLWYLWIICGVLMCLCIAYIFYPDCVMQKVKYRNENSFVAVANNKTKNDHSDSSIDRDEIDQEEEERLQQWMMESTNNDVTPIKIHVELQPETYQDDDSSMTYASTSLATTAATAIDPLDATPVVE